MNYNNSKIYNKSIKGCKKVHVKDIVVKYNFNTNNTKN